MPVLMTVQDQSASAQVLQVLQGQEAALVKQLAGAEASRKSYEQSYSRMSATDRDFNFMVRQNRIQKVVGLRGELDALRQQMAEVRAGVKSDHGQVIAQIPDGPVIVTDAPATVASTEPPLTVFGLTPHQLRGPAEFLLLLPLVIALSRWIWRRSPGRPVRENPLEGNPQISRLEQAVESIAIEVERIGEAQRFSAKLMAERPREPVIERIRDAAKAPRRVITPLP